VRKEDDAADALPVELHAALSRVLRSLLRELDRGGVGMEPEVIADLDVEGVRYTLSRQAQRVPASPAPKDPNPAVASLSSRELEIARMVAKGYTNKTVAAILDISSWTVDTHIRRIFRKLGVCSRSAMVAQLASAQAVAAEDDETPDWAVALGARGSR
jgi:DNA-binding CsgD family transcriptional regulator